MGIAGILEESGPVWFGLLTGSVIYPCNEEGRNGEVLR
jgi:hypothetical protein